MSTTSVQFFLFDFVVISSLVPKLYSCHILICTEFSTSSVSGHHYHNLYILFRNKVNYNVRVSMYISLNDIFYYMKPFVLILMIILLLLMTSYEVAQWFDIIHNLVSLLYISLMLSLSTG